MKSMLVMIAFVILGLTTSVARAANLASIFSTNATTTAPLTAVDGSDDVSVDDRYLVPDLPTSVIEHLPATEIEGDRYLAERIELADLVIGDRIIAAEDLATTYGRDLPGFTDVLLADGFRPGTNGVWYYDRFESWMRFPLNR